MQDRRIGTFRINMRFVEAHPEKVREFFNHYQIIVIRAEAKYVSNSIEYEGIADIFEELKEGYMPENYDIITYNYPDDMEKESELRFEEKETVCKQKK